MDPIARPRHGSGSEATLASSELVHIPAREGRAARVPAGRRFRVVDVEGGQVVDLFAFAAEDVEEYASAEHTRVAVSRLFPRVGESFVTNRRRPILFFDQDTSPGIHDMLCASCDPERYLLLGVDGWHASCRENLETAMAALGFDSVRIPQPINLFMNTPAREDGTIQWLPAVSQPGDHVVLRAEMDIVVVASACPQDLNAINAKGPGPAALELL
jgi:uncharacterized protein YcgI (DUF1989 family)